MRENPWLGKVGTVAPFKNQDDRTIILLERTNAMLKHRIKLEKRFESLNLQNRYRKQYKEIYDLLSRYDGKRNDLLNDDKYNLDREKLRETVTKILKSWRAIDETVPHISDREKADREKADREIYGTIEEMILKQDKVLTLREKYTANEELANVRIEELLNFVEP